MYILCMKSGRSPLVYSSPATADKEETREARQNATEPWRPRTRGSPYEPDQNTSAQLAYVRYNTRV